MLIGTKQHVRAIDARVPVIHAERFEPAIRNRVPVADGNHCGPNEDGLAKRQAEARVLRVHESVGSRLDFGSPAIEIERSRSAGRNDWTSHSAVGRKQPLHRLLAKLRAHAPIDHTDRVSFVPHHSAHLEATASRFFSKLTGLLGRAAATWQPDVHVDEYTLDASLSCGQNGGWGIDCDGHRPVPQSGEAVDIQHFVGQQNVVGKASECQTFSFAYSGTAERRVPVLALELCERSAFVRFYVRPQARAGKMRGHGCKIFGEHRGIDNQGRSGEIFEPHRLRRLPLGNEGLSKWGIEIHLCAFQNPREHGVKSDH